jgi:hypothetical protein
MAGRLASSSNHVASVYPIEIHLAKLLASGEPVGGVTWEAVATMNHDHAKANDGMNQKATLDVLAKNSAAAAPVSLNSDAPLTCQFILENHAVRHSYHHLTRIRAALGR